ncbi:angiopoietin-related protein 6 [Spea bombifrons]|uniref:angiopoietin-related protein 6 n=1 Tax=Spea bombifrons TaxID=233779 RepID=UPI00234912E6|nr:angiopoietin-related protein 6 [Spea bombifrons]
MAFYNLLCLATVLGHCLSQMAGEHSMNSDTTRPKCTYTFVVPQQKITGAICVSTARFPEAFGVNRSEVQELKEELNRQQLEIEELKKLVEVDHDVATEMEHLRKESRIMGSRLGHLQTQLLHEVLQRKNETADIFQSENKGINTSSEVLTLASKYRELQEKYQLLASIINNQSLIIARLEEQCLQSTVRHQADQVPVHPPTDGRKLLSSEIQKDQTGNSPQGNIPQAEEDIVIKTSNAPVAMVTEAPKPSGPWLDCYEALLDGQKSNGIYLLKPLIGNQVMQAWCEQNVADGGWTVIQRRQDGSINFFTTWHSYKHGFGNLDSEYWLGLENIYWLTSQGSYKLLILMEDWQGRQVHAQYDHFRLEPESDFYRLRLGQYHGNAGNSLSWHNGKQFSTLDKDRDSYSGNCAHYQKGGWWYNMCAHSNLNGVWYRGGHYRSRYQDGVYWAEFHGGAYSLKKVSMLVKPNK